MQRFTTRSLILFYGSKISCFCEWSSSSRGGCWVEMPWISCREKSQRQNSCHWTSSQDHPPPPHNITPFTIPSSKSTDLQHQCHHQQQQRCLEDLFCIYAFLTESDPLKCLIILIKWQNWRRKKLIRIITMILIIISLIRAITQEQIHKGFMSDIRPREMRHLSCDTVSLCLNCIFTVFVLYFLPPSLWHCPCVTFPNFFLLSHFPTHMSRVVAARRTLRHKWPENRHRALWEISPLLFLRILLKKIHSNQFKL